MGFHTPGGASLGGRVHVAAMGHGSLCQGSFEFLTMVGISSPKSRGSQRGGTGLSCK